MGNCNATRQMPVNDLVKIAKARLSDDMVNGDTVDARVEAAGMIAGISARPNTSDTTSAQSIENQSTRALALVELELGLQRIDPLRGICLANILGRQRFSSLFAQCGKIGGLRASHGIVARDPVVGRLLRVRTGMLVEFGVVHRVGHSHAPCSCNVLPKTARRSDGSHFLRSSWRASRRGPLARVHARLLCTDALVCAKTLQRVGSCAFLKT